MNRYRVVVYGLYEGDVIRQVFAHSPPLALFEAGRVEGLSGVQTWDALPEGVTALVIDLDTGREYRFPTSDEPDPTPDRAASYVGLSLMAKAILFGGMLSW